MSLGQVKSAIFKLFYFLCFIVKHFFSTCLLFLIKICFKFFFIIKFRLRVFLLKKKLNKKAKKVKI